MDKLNKYICTTDNKTDIKYAEDTLYVLSGKWRLAVIVSIFNGNHRYREIAKSIPGITFTMLFKELKLMELNQLVIRTEDPDFPKDVDYRLTDYCESLYPLVEQLIFWGKDHRNKIKE